MKKTLTFLFAFMLISTFSFGLGNLFTWTGLGGNSLWTTPGNWSKTNLPYDPGGVLATANLYPGGPLGTEDWARFDNGVVFDLVTMVPNITLGVLEIAYFNPFTITAVCLDGAFDGATITLQTPTVGLMGYYGGLGYWTAKLDDNCMLDLNNFFGNFAPPFNRVKMVCQPDAHFWQKNGASFYPADYLLCDGQQGFVLQANAAKHAEFIQQQLTSQPVKGWVEYILDDFKYHFIAPPVTSEFTPEFIGPGTFCRTHNCLCIFDGDYVRKYTNGSAVWDNWLGNVGTCFVPIVDIQTGRGYEYYGSGVNPSGKYSFYGTFNSQDPLNVPNYELTLPVTSAGWNFVGNPFASAIRFAEPSGTPTAGIGWFWDETFTDPVAWWWDNGGLGFYRYYNWYDGSGNGLNAAERRTVPRSQGFFVHVTTFAPGAIHAPSGSDVAVGNEARLFRGTEQIGKSGIANNLQVTLNDASSNFMDDAIIHFRDDVNGTEFNRLLDVYKRYNDITNVSQLYFKTTNNVDVALKTLKLATGNVMYPLYMKVINTGTYSIDVKDINTFSPNTGILLKDNKTNTTVDLKLNPVYTFTATAGDNNARFSLYFTDVLYGINNLDDNTFKVYSYNNSIYIQNNDPKSITGTVLVYDMIGKQMMQEDLTGDAITRINTNLNKGFYIVSIKTDKSVYNQKVYIN